MDWALLIKALVPCFYVLLSIAILRNISVFPESRSPPTTTFVNQHAVYQDHEYDASSTQQWSSSPLPGSNGTRARNLPKCLIIGVRKGGTRALLDALALHPQIKIVRHEVHFFDTNETYAKGADWYRSQMPLTTPEQVAIEKTPAYFINKLSPQRVHQMIPLIKLIVIVRDPVIRTISDFTQVLCTRQERNKTQVTFEKSAFLDDGVTINVNYKPVGNSLYAVHMRQWLSYFPLESFLFLDGDKFITDPLTQLRQVERFLHVGSRIREDQLVFDEHKGFYCFRRRSHLKAKCLGNSKGRPHANVSASTRNILRRNFDFYNKEFFKLVNRQWNW